MRAEIRGVPFRTELRALACLIALTVAVATGRATAQAEPQKSPSRSPQTSSQASSEEVENLRREVQALRQREEESRARMAELEAAVQRLLAVQPAAPAAATAGGERETDSAPTAASDAPASPAPGPSSPAAALDRALAAGSAATVESPQTPTVPSTSGAGRSDLWSMPLGRGGAQARLIDTSLITLFAAGGSSVGNNALADLQGGAHDPNQNGFTLQQVELSFTGAVDPYFTGETHIVATPDGVELEEAFFTTSALPWGLQVEAGHFFTEFGLINPTHPHAWDWIDQPVVNTRLFGGDGTRSPGARVAWLLPTPFFSELHLGVQNANTGEFTPSFVGEEGVGGRPNRSHDVRGLGDLLWLVRSNSAWDLGSEAALLLGFSGLHGPNQTGPDGETWIYGADAKLRWRPAANFRGWPFVLWQAEFLRRDYDADGFTAGTDVDPSSGEFPNDLPGDTLHDHGLYTQLLYGFRYRWAAGLRGEYASGSGQSVDGGGLAPRREDPLRDDRARVAPLLVWHPTEFSRLRLQYNYDMADHLEGGDAHTIWIGAEVLYGKHAAHKY